MTQTIQDLNQLNQQLRGKMRVYARIKPKDSLDSEFNSLIQIPDATAAATLNLIKPFETRLEPLKYHFDGIFGPTTEQAVVF